VATVYSETNSWKWTLFNLLLLLVISFGLGILVFQIASLVT